MSTVKRRPVRIEIKTGRHYRYPYPVYHRIDKRWVTARLQPSTDVNIAIRRLELALRTGTPSAPSVKGLHATTGTPTPTTVRPAKSALDSGIRRRLIVASLKHPSLLRSFLDHGLVDPNAQLTHRRCTGRRYRLHTERLIHIAASRGNPDVVDLLLTFGATPNVVDSNSDTPLHVAVRNSDTTVAAVLLSRGGADPDARDHRGDAPLHVAARQGHRQLVSSLLEHGADPATADRRHGDQPVHIAAACGHAHVVEAICRADPSSAEARSGTVGCRPLHLAAAEGHVETIRSLIGDNIGVDVAVMDDEGNTPLHRLVSRPYQQGTSREIGCYYAAAVELIKRGAPVNQSNAAGLTPLALAAANQFPRIAQLLVANGAKMCTTPRTASISSTPDKKFNFPSSPPAKQLKISPSKQLRAGKISPFDSSDDGSDNNVPDDYSPTTAITASTSSTLHTSNVATVSSITDNSGVLKRKGTLRPSQPHPAPIKSDFEPVTLRRPRPSMVVGKPSIENEISTFSVVTRVGGERMTILLDKKHTPNNDDRVRSRLSIEGEMNRIANIDHPSDKSDKTRKLVAVDIDITNEDGKGKQVNQTPTSTQRSTDDGAGDQAIAVASKKKKKRTADRDESGSSLLVKSSKKTGITTTSLNYSKQLDDVKTNVCDDDDLLVERNLTSGWTDDMAHDVRMVSPVALHDVRRYSTPPFRLGILKSPFSVTSDVGYGMRRMRMQVAGVVPKAYNRRQKDAARTAFFAARPVGIEMVGVGDHVRDDVSMISMASMPEMGYIAWERAMERRRKWSEPLEPVYGKPMKFQPGRSSASLNSMKSRSLGDISRRLEGKPLIGPYASPYHTVGPIDVRTDAIEEALMADSFNDDDDGEWSDDDLPEPYWNSAEMEMEMQVPPQILNRHEAVQELLSRSQPTVSAKDSQPVTNNDDSVTRKVDGNLPTGRDVISGDIVHSGKAAPQVQRLTVENVVLAGFDSSGSGSSSSSSEESQSEEEAPPLPVSKPVQTKDPSLLPKPSPVKSILKSSTKYNGVATQSEDVLTARVEADSELRSRQVSDIKQSRTSETKPEQESPSSSAVGRVDADLSSTGNKRAALNKKTKDVGEDKRAKVKTSAAASDRVNKTLDDWNVDAVEEYEEEPGSRRKFSEIDRSGGSEIVANLGPDDEDLENYETEPGSRRSSTKRGLLVEDGSHDQIVIKKTGPVDSVAKIGDARPLSKEDDELLQVQNVSSSTNQRIKLSDKKKPWVYQSVLSTKQEKSGFGKLSPITVVSSMDTAKSKYESSQTVTITSSLRTEVWREAMSDQPLASSETIHEQNSLSSASQKSYRPRRSKTVRDLKKATRSGDIDVDLPVMRGTVDDSTAEVGSVRRLSSIDTGVSETSVDEDLEIVLSDSNSEPPITIAKVCEEFMQAQHPPKQLPDTVINDAKLVAPKPTSVTGTPSMTGMKKQLSPTRQHAKETFIDDDIEMQSSELVVSADQSKKDRESVLNDVDDPARRTDGQAQPWPLSDRQIEVSSSEAAVSIDRVQEYENVSVVSSKIKHITQTDSEKTSGSRSAGKRSSTNRKSKTTEEETSTSGLPPPLLIEMSPGELIPEVEVKRDDKVGKPKQTYYTNEWDQNKQEIPKGSDDHENSGQNDMRHAEHSKSDRSIEKSVVTETVTGVDRERSIKRKPSRPKLPEENSREYEEYKLEELRATLHEAEQRKRSGGFPHSTKKENRSETVRKPEHRSSSSSSDCEDDQSPSKDVSLSLAKTNKTKPLEDHIRFEKSEKISSKTSDKDGVVGSKQKVKVGQDDKKLTIKHASNSATDKNEQGRPSSEHGTSSSSSSSDNNDSDHRRRAAQFKATKLIITESKRKDNNKSTVIANDNDKEEKRRKPSKSSSSSNDSDNRLLAQSESTELNVEQSKIVSRKTSDTSGVTGNKRKDKDGQGKTQSIMKDLDEDEKRRKPSESSISESSDDSDSHLAVQPRTTALKFEKSVTGKLKTSDKEVVKDSKRMVESGQNNKELGKIDDSRLTIDEDETGRKPSQSNISNDSDSHLASQTITQQTKKSEKVSRKSSNKKGVTATERTCEDGQGNEYEKIRKSGKSRSSNDGDSRLVAQSEDIVLQDDEQVKTSGTHTVSRKTSRKDRIKETSREDLNNERALKEVAPLDHTVDEEKASGDIQTETLEAKLEPEERLKRGDRKKKKKHVDEWNNDVEMENDGETLELSGKLIRKENGRVKRIHSRPPLRQSLFDHIELLANDDTLPDKSTEVVVETVGQYGHKHRDSSNGRMIAGETTGVSTERAPRTEMMDELNEEISSNEGAHPGEDHSGDSSSDTDHLTGPHQREKRHTSDEEEEGEVEQEEEQEEEEKEEEQQITDKHRTKQVNEHIPDQKSTKRAESSVKEHITDKQSAKRAESSVKEHITDKQSTKRAESSVKDQQSNMVVSPPKSVELTEGVHETHMDDEDEQGEEEFLEYAPDDRQVINIKAEQSEEFDVSVPLKESTPERDEVISDVIAQLSPDKKKKRKKRHSSNTDERSRKSANDVEFVSVTQDKYVHVASDDDSDYHGNDVEIVERPPIERSRYLDDDAALSDEEEKKVKSVQLVARQSTTRKVERHNSKKRVSGDKRNTENSMMIDPLEKNEVVVPDSGNEDEEYEIDHRLPTIERPIVEPFHSDGEYDVTYDEDEQLRQETTRVDVAEFQFNRKQSNRLSLGRSKNRHKSKTARGENNDVSTEMTRAFGSRWNEKQHSLDTNSFSTGDDLEQSGVKSVDKSLSQSSFLSPRTGSSLDEASTLPVNKKTNVYGEEITTTTTTTTTTLTKNRQRSRDTSRRSLSSEDTKRVSSDVLRVARQRHQRRPRTRSVSFDVRRRYVVAYDRDNQLQPLRSDAPKRSLQQAAMDTLTADSLLGDQRPRLKKQQNPLERPVVYTRGVYRPQPVYWKSKEFHAAPVMGDQLDGETNDLERNVEPPLSQSMVEQILNRTTSTQGSEHKSAFVPVGSGSKRPQIKNSYRLRSPRRYVTAPAQREDPRSAAREQMVSEPGPVDFQDYGIVARMWMERVDMKTVHKSKTMYLSVMPRDLRPPEQLIRALKYQSPSANDRDDVMPPHWVMVRSRSIQRRRRKQLERRMLGSLGALDGGYHDNLPQSPSGNQSVLFFQIGIWWKDLAWTLFEGVQSDGETVRMIADIELKSPGRLDDQVRDLMARWWKRRGTEATVEELRECLDLVGVTYVQEECPSGVGRPSLSTSFVFDSDHDELDVGEVADTDPNVSRLMRSYRVRSMNASFGPETTRRRGGSDLDVSGGEALSRNISLPPSRMVASINGLATHHSSFDGGRRKPLSSSSSMANRDSKVESVAPSDNFKSLPARNVSLRTSASMDSLNLVGNAAGDMNSSLLKAHDFRHESHL